MPRIHPLVSIMAAFVLLTAGAIGSVNWYREEKRNRMLNAAWETMLGEYAGTYVSDEADATFTLAVERVAPQERGAVIGQLGEAAAHVDPTNVADESRTHAAVERLQRIKLRRLRPSVGSSRWRSLRMPTLVLLTPACSTQVRLTPPGLCRLASVPKRSPTRSQSQVRRRGLMADYSISGIAATFFRRISIPATSPAALLDWILP